MQSEMMKRASELLADGTVVRVLGWKNGEFVYDPTPAVFDSAEALEKDFVYHDFCGSNLSKYLIKLSKLDGKTLVFLKPCDSYSFNQLLTEHRIKRENVYIIGIPCDGKLDAEKVRDAGAEGILGITTDGDTVKVDTMYGEVSVAKKDCLLERCEVCKSHKVVVYDEMLGENGEENPESGRFDMVEKLEAMTCVCSVGLDMIAIPGNTKATTISGIIADEMAIGMVNQKTTAVRVIPVVGKDVGDMAEFGGLLGYAPIMPVNEFDCSAFVNRKGRIPAPIHSFKN